MQIVIDIPKEFEEHFNSDRFEDSLQRVRFDIHKSIIGNKNVLSGNYEIETLDMLTEAFLNSTPLPEGHGRLIDVDALIKQLEAMANNRWNIQVGVSKGLEEAIDIVDDAPTIIEAESEEEQ